MRTLSVSVALVVLTGLAVCFHQPTTGHAEAARTQPASATAAEATARTKPTTLPVWEMGEADLARLLLKRAEQASANPTTYEHALAYYQAALALESLAGGGEPFVLARQQYDRLLVKANLPKGQVHALAAKIDSPPATRVQPTLLPRSQPEPVASAPASPAPVRVISVGPDGLVYDEEP
jgi:hypothetical protein